MQKLRIKVLATTGSLLGLTLAAGIEVPASAATLIAVAPHHREPPQQDPDQPLLQGPR